MQIAMVKPGRTGFQMVYSQRDLVWMEKEGWTRLEPKVPALLKPPIETAVDKRKPGRPRKAALETQ
jgi:hypothetical protein